VNQRDADFAEAVRRSAEYMRLHEDEPNEFIPKARYCARCETRGYEEDDTAVRCKTDCGEWLCGECGAQYRICEACEIEKAEAVAAEAARLEAQVEADREKWARVQQLGNP
jgi:hypothetical protein